MTVKRKTPIRHRVKPHIRQGKKVKSYQRGTGARKSRRRVVGDYSKFPVSKFPRFKTLKRRGRFSAPDSWIEPGIRKLCRELDKLPYLAVIGSCEGHTWEELIARDYATPAEIKNVWPLGYAPASVTMFVLADERFKLWKWIKENIGMDKVEIYTFPEFESGSDISKFIYRDETPTFVRDKLFTVGITSKSLRMPFKSKK